MEVTDVLRDRMSEPKGLDRMFGASLLAHLVLVAGFIFAPGGWLDSRKEPPKTIMDRSDRAGSSAPSHDEPAEPLTDDDIPF